MNRNSMLVRINYEVDNVHKTDDRARYKAHIGKGSKSTGKYMICGGIYNKNGGMIIYEAKNKEEAKAMEIRNIMTNDIGRKYKQTKKDVISIPTQLIY